MSVPFVPSIAVGAVDVMTGSMAATAGRGTVLDTMQLRFPDHHPMLIDEHIHYAGLLLQEAAKLAIEVKNHSLSREEAFARLQSGFENFPGTSIERALGDGLERA